MNPEISIGLTFYNNAATIADALRSIFVQTFVDWELIIIDDNSTDGSFEIAERVRDARVRLYKEEKRMGFVHALNRMTSLARGTYYARMDADDMMHPERLSRQIKYLKDHPDIDVVDTPMISMDQQCRAVGVRYAGPIDPRPEVLLRANFFYHATIMGRTEWFKKNPYDPEYLRAEDCELWCRTFRTSRFGRIAEPLYIVREGLVNVRNYLMSSRTVRKIVRKYGPVYVGKAKTTRLIAESHAKSCAYRLFSLLRLHDMLVRVRNRELDEKERILADAVIERVRSAEVPGLQ